MSTPNDRATGCLSDFLMLTLVGPFGTIWSLNTLFDADIPLNFATWFGMVFLIGMLNRSWKKSEW